MCDSFKVCNVNLWKLLVANSDHERCLLPGEVSRCDSDNDPTSASDLSMKQLNVIKPSLIVLRTPSHDVNNEKTPVGFQPNVSHNQTPMFQLFRLIWLLSGSVASMTFPLTPPPQL